MRNEMLDEDGDTRRKKRRRPADDDLDISSTCCLCVVFGVSLLSYLNTIDAGFVYDDQRAILTNKDLLPSSSWWRIFNNDFWGKERHTFLLDDMCSSLSVNKQSTESE